MSDEAQEAAEEAAWELETAETLRARGEISDARTWYLRAADHLMDAGEDARALEIAKLAASLAEPAAAPEAAPAAAPEAAPEQTREVTPGTSAEAAPELPSRDAEVVAAQGDSSSGAAATASPFPPAASINAPAPGPAPSPFPPARSEPPPSRIPMPSSVIPAPVTSRPVAPRPAPAAPSAVVPAPSARPRGERSSAPPRASLTWRADRGEALETLWARLLALPLFQDFTPNRLRALSRQVSLVEREVGDVLLRAQPFGEAPIDTPLVVIIDGAASMWAFGAAAPHPLGAGDTVGEAGALYGGPSVVDASVEEPVTAVTFAPALTRALMKESDSFREVLEEAAWERAFAALGHGAPLLRHAPEAARAQVYSGFEPFALKEGDVLLREGESPAWVWLVAAGVVEVYGGELDPLAVWRARAGDALGVEASAGDGPSAVTARALRDGLAARVSAEAFRALVLSHPTLRGALDEVGVEGRGIIC